jgi:hypothetical protein
MYFMRKTKSVDFPEPVAPTIKMCPFKLSTSSEAMKNSAKEK